MKTQAEQAELLLALHVPGDPLILTNVWDAATARLVAGVPGVRAIASASHSVSSAHGVSDGEGLTLDQALTAARAIVDAVDLPVTIDFERAYARAETNVETEVEVEHNVGRLIETGAVGINLEDSIDGSSLFAIEVAAARVGAARRAAVSSGIPLVINARVDALARGGAWDDMVARANAYLAAGADCAFVLGLNTEDDIQRAVAEIDGRVSVIAGATSVPLRRLAELGVSRVSFGPGILGLTLSHLRDAVAVLSSRGEYPPELAFEY